MSRALCRGVAVTLLLAVATAWRAQAQTTPTVYTTSPSASGNVFYGASGNPQSGPLAATPGSPYNERLDGATMAVDALGRFLFVLNPTHNDISMFQIDSNTGTLAEVPNSPFATGVFLNPNQAPANPIALATEPTGQYLYVGFAQGSFFGTPGPIGLHGDGAIDAYQINAQQLALVPTPQTELDLPLGPMLKGGMATDATHGNLYVASNATQTDTIELQVFQIDLATGTLTSVYSPTTGPQPQMGRTAAFDPLGRFVYHGYGQNEGLVGGIELSPVDGLPTGQTNALVIENGQATIGQFPKGMVVDGSGAYLYVLDSSGAMHVYAIDPTSGNLTEMAVGSTAIAFPAVATGPYVYFPGGVSQVNTQTGALTSVTTFPDGTNGAVGITVTGNSSIGAISEPYPEFDTKQLALQDAMVGSTSSTSDRIFNAGSQPLLINLSSIGFSGTNPGDFSQKNNCPVSLGPHAFCTFTITFSPMAAGLRQASLDISDNGPGGKQSIAVSGNGLPALPAITVPSTVTFSTIPAATTTAQNIMVMNSGSAPLHVMSVVLSGANPGDFSVNSNTCTTGAIAIGSSCTVGMTFQPQAAGQRTALLQFTDDAPGTTQSVTLNGNATNPYAISINSTSSATQTVTAGGTASYGLQLMPAAGFSGTVQLQCAGAPAATTCTVPQTLQVTSGTPLNFSAMVRTTASSQMAPSPRDERWPSVPWGVPVAAVLLGFLSLLWAREMHLTSCTQTTQAHRWPSAMVACLALLAAMALAGCSMNSGSSNGTNGTTGTMPGTYALTVTGTSGSVIAPATTLTLIVK